MVNIKEAVDQYIYELKRLNKSPHTTKQYFIDLQQFTKYAAEQGVLKITDDAFESLAIDYEQALVSQQFAPTSVRRKVSSLRSFVRFLEKMKFLQSSFYQKIVHTASWEVETYVPTEREMYDIYHFYNPNMHLEKYDDWLVLRNRSIVQTMADTGLKVAQMMRIQYGHLQDDQTIALVQRDLSFRSITIDKGTWQRLHDYLEETATFFEFTWENEDYVWFGKVGLQKRPLSERTFERTVQRATETLGSKARGSELRYFQLMQQYLKEGDVEALAERFQYETAAPAKKRLEQLLDQK